MFRQIAIALGLCCMSVGMCGCEASEPDLTDSMDGPIAGIAKQFIKSVEDEDPDAMAKTMTGSFSPHMLSYRMLKKKTTPQDLKILKQMFGGAKILRVFSYGENGGVTIEMANGRKIDLDIVKDKKTGKWRLHLMLD